VLIDLILHQKGHWICVFQMLRLYDCWQSHVAAAHLEVIPREISLEKESVVVVYFLVGPEKQHAFDSGWGYYSTSTAPLSHGFDNNY
jgi:hypothetical protein